MYRQQPMMFNQIRKSKDYVCGMWVYKVLVIGKGYYRVKRLLVSCMKQNYLTVLYIARWTFCHLLWCISICKLIPVPFILVWDIIYHKPVAKKYIGRSKPFSKLECVMQLQPVKYNNTDQCRIQIYVTSRTLLHHFWVEYEYWWVAAIYLMRCR